MNLEEAFAVYLAYDRISPKDWRQTLYDEAKRVIKAEADRIAEDHGLLPE